MKKYFGSISLAFIFCFTSSLMLVSCKSKKAIVEATAINTLSTENIIDNLYNNKKDFSTLYIKSSVHYENEKQSQNVTAEIKIKKDEIILISIRFLGITMAKTMITPKEVKYYEKINNSYFEGDFSSLSKWLGTDLDFQKIQNLLIGQALEDLRKGKYTSTFDDKCFKLEDSSDANITKICFIESDKFLIKKQEITQKSQERTLEISYPNYLDYNQYTMPTSMIINAIQKNDNTKINVDYNNVTFNDELSFPYSTPEGSKRVFIN